MAAPKNRKHHHTTRHPATAAPVVTISSDIHLGETTKRRHVDIEDVDVHNMMSIALDEASAVMGDTHNRLELLKNIIEDQLYETIEVRDNHKSFHLLVMEARKLTRQICR